MSELTQLCIMAALDELETGTDDLNEETKTTIAELKYLEILAKELEMTRAADIVSEQIKKIEKLKKTSTVDYQRKKHG